VFAFIQTGTQVTLLLTVSLSSVLTGLGSSREIVGLHVSTARLLLLGAGLFGVFAGLTALRQMDDKHGVPLLADLVGSVRGRPLTLGAGVVARAGVFVVLEGGDGAGKTTHAERLAELLRADGHEVVLTREPGATDVGRLVRGLLLTDGPFGVPVAAPRTEALLYAADRAHHVATVIRPALERGAVVICERFVDSSLAYLEAGRTLPVDEVAWLASWATGGLKPDLVILLDIDPVEGLRRASHRPEGGADPAALQFAERVRYAFLDRSAKDPKRYLVLDASRPVESVAQLIVDRVEHLLPVDPNRPVPRHPRPADERPEPPGPGAAAGSPVPAESPGAGESPVAGNGAGGPDEVYDGTARIRSADPARHPGAAAGDGAEPLSGVERRS
jgi:dTMP kinase